MPAGATYTTIATTTLGSAQSSVTFSSISGSYTDLVLIMDATASTNFTNIKIVINSDTGTNYSWTNLKGDGSSASSARGSNTADMYLGLVNNTGRGTYRFMFNNYSNTTTNKTVLSAGGLAGNRVEYGVGLWRNTAAITSIQLVQPADTFAANSTFSLYGIAVA